MFIPYTHADQVPIVELTTEPVVCQVGPERFWNTHNAVLTQIYNTLNVLDRHCVGFLVRALEHVCATEKDLPDSLVEHTKIYIHHLKKSKENTSDHIELMEQLGYNSFIPESLRFDSVFPINALSNQQLLALVNVYSWMTFCVSHFLLSQSWYLSSASVKSTVVLRWRWLMEEIHKGLLPALQDQLDIPASVYKKAWWSLNLNGNKIFARIFFRLLKADGCFTWKQLPHTLWMMYKIFLDPMQGFNRFSWRFMRLYRKHAGDSSMIDSAPTMDELLLNAQLYIKQINPEVDNRAFFSGRYFQDLRR